MAEAKGKLSHLLPLKAVICIISFLIGIPLGVLGPVTLQAIQYLVSVELGYEDNGVNGTQPAGHGACSGVNTSIISEANIEIQTRTTLIVNVLSILTYLPSVPLTFLISSWLDSPNSSKRKAAMFPSVGSAIYMGSFLVIMGAKLSPWFAIIPSIVLGISGNFFLQIATMLIYVGSTSKESERSPYLLSLQMFNLLGQGAASLSIGYLIQIAGFTVTFAVLFLMCAFTSVFVYLFLSEIEMNSTLADADNEAYGLRQRFQTTIQNVRAVFWDPDTGRCQCALIVIAMAFFIYSILCLYLLVILQIVMLGEPFCWSPSLIGYFSAAKLVCVAVGMMIAAHILKTWFDDFALAQIGFVSAFVSTLIPVYARTDAGLFLVAAFGAFRFVPGSVLTSKISKVVKQKSYGGVFGLLSAIECLSTLVAVFVFGMVYEATVEDNPKLVFKLIAGLIAVPASLILSLQCWQSSSGAANYKKLQNEALIQGSSSK